MRNHTTVGQAKSRDKLRRIHEQQMNIPKPPSVTNVKPLNKEKDGKTKK